MSQPPRIGLMGPGAPDPETMEMAREIGRGVAARGAVLVCGGGGGAMEGASQGAAEAGGIVLGILSARSASHCNPWVTIPVVTDMGNARNAINVLTSQVIIAVRGGYGTLSEIALALKCGTPVVALDSWRLEKIGCNDPLFHVVNTPEEAVDKAFELIS